MRRPPAWLLVTGTVLLLASATLSARVADADSGYDLLGLLHAVAADLARLRWQFTAVVAVLAALHYAATALATRAASGVRLPLGETVLVQLAAAAANRISVAGAGGSAVNARYFARRGLPVASAVSAVVLLAVLGSIADLLVLAGVVAGGRWVGLGGASGELGALASKAAGLVAPFRSAWLWLAVLAAVVVVVAARRRLAGLAGRLWAPVVGLRREPGRLAMLLAASGATTLLLALAFVASVAMVPGRVGHVGAGSLLVGFMFAAAAGNAVPMPAGIGSTETALIAVLVGTGVPTAHAVEVVVVYRILTFWLPPLFGLAAVRRLHRTGAL
ncbi:MAG TPA: lysylphosphatidylglycerol synthase domain-containing protein [Jatrophihabitans sp.]|nr:lysylphosphatidylglycerol synthase domain-containing protein [Jatrophihabitans sp.]